MSENPFREDLVSLLESIAGPDWHRQTNHLAGEPPRPDPSGRIFQALFNLREIQEIQDAFARATGVASIITRTDGVPLTRPSNFCDLCENIIRKTEKGLRNCFRSDSRIGRHNPEGPVIQTCLSGGLWDAGASITAGRIHIANWLIGQVRNEATDREKMRAYAREIEADEKAFLDALEKVTVMSSEQFEQVSRALFLMANQMSQRAFQNLQLNHTLSKLHRAQKMELVGTLAGGVAHDLNNILGAIVAYPDMLLMELPGDSPLRPMVEQMGVSGQRAADIVQDLLTLARRGVTVKEVINLNDVISGYLESPEHGKLARDHPRLVTETALEEDLLNILGSPAHLSKAVMNLVINAAEAMPRGGTVRISTENIYLDRGRTEHDDVREGDYVLLRISDQGTGISTMDRDRIFEPFYTRKEMGTSGTGLGMSVVWGTVKDLEGHISVESAPGEGSTFYLYFPITRKEAAEPPKSLTVEDYRGRGERILVIDDMAEQREIASALLSRLGYDVSTVSSGPEALAFMGEHNVDLLVLDMIMDPGWDGLETYRRILERHPGQKAIIASGFSETDRVREAQKLGAAVYIKKPYTLVKLGTAVRDELARGRG